MSLSNSAIILLLEDRKLGNKDMHTIPNGPIWCSCAGIIGKHDMMQQSSLIVTHSSLQPIVKTTPVPLTR